MAVTDTERMAAAKLTEDIRAMLSRQLLLHPLRSGRIDRALKNIEVMVRRELECLLAGEE